MSGVILWEGESEYDQAPIALIATTDSQNKATGPMIQTWIIRQDEPPSEAAKAGDDESTCGQCPLRPITSGVCYVQLSWAPNTIWRTYQAGGYARIHTAGKAARWLAGERVRLGAYGDPAMVPFEYTDRIMRDVDKWTGYTHQFEWADPRWAGYVMASAETDAAHEKAKAQGYRTFNVYPKGSTSGGEGMVQCAKDRTVNPLQCADCLMCSGTRRGTVSNAVDVWIGAHGRSAARISNMRDVSQIETDGGV